MTARRGCIYALCDRHGEPYYVGRTVQSPGARLGEHRREATSRGRDSDVHRRTRELIAAGEGPAVWVLEAGVALRALTLRERHWISWGQGAGWTLLNYTGGGNGSIPLNERQRDRQRRNAARQPRDAWRRFLSFASAEAVDDAGQLYSVFGLAEEGLPF